MKIARVQDRPAVALDASGMGGMTSLPSVEDLTDVDVTGIANGQVLVWNAASSTRVPSSSSGIVTVGTTDHDHVMDILMSGDGSTTAFELPAAPFDAYSVAAFVAGTLTEVTLSGTLLTTATFGSAPSSATNNIRFDIVAAVA